ncbi:MAG TPA: STY0301 family protein [Telluria sp.]|nr:STY0301 family protein [Telluria sp.]
MKSFVALALALASFNVEAVECPRFYPFTSPEVPHGHSGGGQVRKAALNGAGVYTGAFIGQEETIGIPSKIKDGYQRRYAFAPNEQKWLVCGYGKNGEVQWWERLDPKATSCVLQVKGKERAVPEAVTITCR